MDKLDKPINIRLLLWTTLWTSMDKPDKNFEKYGQSNFCWLLFLGLI